MECLHSFGPDSLEFSSVSNSIPQMDPISRIVAFARDIPLAVNIKVERALKHTHTHTLHMYTCIYICILIGASPVIVRARRRRVGVLSIQRRRVARDVVAVDVCLDFSPVGGESRTPKHERRSVARTSLFGRLRGEIEVARIRQRFAPRRRYNVSFGTAG